jgi:hypothetical protein
MNRECRVETDADGWITAVIWREGVTGALPGTVVTEEQGREMSQLLGVARLQGGAIEVPDEAVIRQRWRERRMPGEAINDLLSRTSAERQRRINDRGA